MNRLWLLLGSLVFGVLVSSAVPASAQCYQGGHYGYSSPYVHSGYGYGVTVARPSYGLGWYGGHYDAVWHNTTHWDYHPGYYQPHFNHYHYVPGHFDLHRSGHFDHVWHGH